MHIEENKLSYAKGSTSTEGIHTNTYLLKEKPYIHIRLYKVNVIMVQICV